MGRWVQDVGGVVRVVARGALPGEVLLVLDAEAARLTQWLDGVVINSIYASRQMKAGRLP